jgi:hypothetical protein
MCDFIVKTSKDKKSTFLYNKLTKRTVPLEGKALDDYISKKRQTNGAFSSWSDGITFEAMAAMLDRPIVQVTYPVYIDGKKRSDLAPRFHTSYCGDRSKVPV